MPEYQKVLQLYRSTTIWQTKGLAKAEIELHAKELHTEIRKSLLDGEPVLGRYYDKLEGYTYVNPEPTELQGDPYSDTTKAANHIWIQGYDEFSVMPDEFGYDSAPYFRVGSGSEWSYYSLTYVPFRNREEEKLGISTVFGVVYKDAENDKLYIEWFDSASEAQAVIDNLNYTDENVTNGFVAAVHQKKGVVEPIHGTLTGVDAMEVRGDAFSYVFKSASVDPTTDIEWVWESGVNTGNTLPTSGLTVTSPKYYHLVNSTTTAVDGYYELRKNVNIALNINDSNNILEQDSQGLKTHLTLQKLSDADTRSLGANVREAYNLIGGTNTVLGDTIKVYKDSSLYRAYLGTVDDTLVVTSPSTHASDNDVMYVWKASGDKYRYTTSKEPDPSTDKAYSQNNELSFLFENGENFEIVDSDTIKVDGVDYDYVDGTTIPAPCVISGGNSTQPGPSEALCFIYLLTDGTYELVKIDIESFIQENEFSDGLIVDSHIVKVRLATDGGINFKDETTGNKSLKIKIDPNNEGYYVYDGNDITGCYEYNSDNNTYTVTSDSSRVSGKTYYKKKTYLTTTNDGLKLNDDVFETKTVDTVQKTLKVNGRGFRKGADGKLSAIISSSDILVAGNEVDGTTTTMKKVVEVDFMVAGGPVSYGKVGEIFADTTSGKVFRVRQNIPSTGVNFDDTTYFENLQYDFIQFNGFVWQWDDTNTIFNKYRINDGTTVNEAIAILDHLAYHIDMGQFNIPNA